MYGFMTHSYLKSGEHRGMKQQRAEFTERYLAGEVRFRCPELLPACNCDYRPWPHVGHREFEEWMSNRNFHLPTRQ